ncbi:MAG: hypothetical protein ACFFAN_07700 [Promethearchaeota archaeon]
MPTINKTTGAFKDAKDPVVLFKMQNKIYADKNIDDDGGDLGQVFPLEVIDDKTIKIKENVHFPYDFVRVIYIGTVQVTGLKTNIRVKTE